MSRQLQPARIEPAPITAIERNADSSGSPYRLTPEGLDFVQRMAAAGATDTAISGALKVARETFRNMRARQPEVDEALARGRSILDLELTHVLLASARGGNPVAALMLGKTRLGWREGNASGAQGVADLPMPSGGMPSELDMSKLTNDECRQLVRLLRKARGQSVEPDAEDIATMSPHDRQQRIDELRSRLPQPVRRLRDRDDESD